MRSFRTELALLLAALLPACIAARPAREAPAAIAAPNPRPALTMLIGAGGTEQVMADELLADAQTVSELPGMDRACMFGNEQIVRAARDAWTGSGLFAVDSSGPGTGGGVHVFVHLRCVVSHAWSYYPFGLTLGIFPHWMEIGLLSNAVVARPGSGLPPVSDVRLLRSRVWADTLLLLAGGWRESPGSALADLAAQSQREVIARSAKLIAAPPAISPGE